MLSIWFAFGYYPAMQTLILRSSQKWGSGGFYFIFLPWVSTVIVCPTLLVQVVSAGWGLRIRKHLQTIVRTSACVLDKQKKKKSHSNNCVTIKLSGNRIQVHLLKFASSCQSRGFFRSGAVVADGNVFAVIGQAVPLVSTYVNNREAVICSVYWSHLSSVLSSDYSTRREHVVRRGVSCTSSWECRKHFIY